MKLIAVKDLSTQHFSSPRLSRAWQALACAHRDNVSDGKFIALVSAKFHVMHISRLLSATAIGDECLAKSRQLHDTFR